MAARVDLAIKSVRKRWQSAKGTNGELNAIFRESLRTVAAYWINNFLPLHFGNQATARYGYRKRSQKYLRRKELVRPDLLPPAPFEYTGELKNYVMANAKSGEMLNASRPISTGVSKKNPNGKLMVTIPVRIPHPINPVNKGELSRVTRAERSELNRLFIEDVNRRLNASPVIVEYQRIQAA